MLTDRLWGGTLRHVALDITTQSLSLSIDVLEGGIASSHELRMSEVSELHFVNAIVGPWDYAEITELHLENDPLSDQWWFDLVLWTEDGSMTGRCRTVILDGLEVTP